jgi:hypothetical protein
LKHFVSDDIRFYFENDLVHCTRTQGEPILAFADRYLGKMKRTRIHH